MSRHAILNFHGLGDPPMDVETSERPYWIAPQMLEALLDTAQASGRPFAVTFDDGNSSDVEIGLERIAGRGLTAQFFVLAGRIGTARYLGRGDIGALIAAGMEVGSHGWDHVDWRRQSDDGLRRELLDSRLRLEDVCGRAVRAAGVPFGAYDARVLRALRKAGYARVYTSDAGLADRRAWLQPRISIRSDMSLTGVSRALTGDEPLRARLRRRVSMALRRVF